MSLSTFSKTQQQQLDIRNQNEPDFENNDDYEKHDEDDDVDTRNQEEKEEQSDDQYSSDCSRSTSNQGEFSLSTWIINTFFLFHLQILIVLFFFQSVNLDFKSAFNAHLNCRRKQNKPTR